MIRDVAENLGRNVECASAALNKAGVKPAVRDRTARDSGGRDALFRRKPFNLSYQGLLFHA